MRIAEIFRLRFLLCHCTEFELRNLTQPELVLALQAVLRLCLPLEAWTMAAWSSSAAVCGRPLVPAPEAEGVLLARRGCSVTVLCCSTPERGV